MTDFSDIGLWVFGYGSIIWRPDFAHALSDWVTVEDWSRRFWQGSHDHRGSVDAPGRVLTLVPMKGAYCTGRVFGVVKPDVDAVLKALDHREKNGYQRQSIRVNSKTIGDISALTYIAPVTNLAWLGDASDKDIAKQIRHAHGPSGSNKSYVLSLHKALLAEGIHDAHIQAIADLLVD